MVAALIKGLFLGILLAISVGPIIFAIIKQSINYGHKAGYVFVAGVSLSDITLLVICNFFTSFFEAVIKHQEIIAIAGSVFLISAGIYTLFFKKSEIVTDSVIPEQAFRKRDWVGAFFSGYFMNMLNPSVFIFWFAWSAAILADAASYSNPLQYRMIVFGTCLVFVLLTDLLKVALAGKLRPKLTPKNLHLINILSGIILVGFGVALIWGILQFGHQLK
jgi:threonine/homoserine/homoserine lactone efflux protein